MLELLTGYWRTPEPSPRLKYFLSQAREGGVIRHCRAIGEGLADAQKPLYRRQLEQQVIVWLYYLIRANVKRGREFDLRPVLETRLADCLGYSKLFTVLGRLCGVDAGVIEVITDCTGRLVPHTAIMVKLAKGGFRFADLWYGSNNVKHRRLGLYVKQGGKWQFQDVWYRELKTLEEVRYLQDSMVDGITLYIIGNGHLKKQENYEALKCYDRALELYPGNPRTLYNRAIVYEKLEQRERADADYAAALRDEDAIWRVLAREDPDVADLMRLDALGIDELEQEVYLNYRAFATGYRERPDTIAGKLGISVDEVEAIIAEVEAKLGENRGV